MVRPRPRHAGDRSASNLRALGRLLAAITLLPALLGGCARVSMRDANDPDRAGATFRYVGMRQGTLSPDYGAIDAAILDDRAPQP